MWTRGRANERILRVDIAVGYCGRPRQSLRSDCANTSFWYNKIKIGNKKVLKMNFLTFFTNFFSLAKLGKKKEGQRKRRGFTLVEIMLSILVIGILSATVLVLIQGPQAAARDSRRQSDISQIGKSLQAYYLTHNTYPQSEEISLENDEESAEFAQAMRTGSYLSIVPEDPSYTAGGEYTYRYISTTSNSYTLCAKAESKEGYYCVSPEFSGVSQEDSVPMFAGWGGGEEGGETGWQIPAGGISGQWGVFLGDQSHTGLHSIAPSAAGNLKWSNASALSSGWSIVADDGTIYTGGSNYLYAVNPANGEIKWNFYKSYNSLNHHPVIASDGKIIVVPDYDGDIIVLSPDDGSIIATSTLPNRRPDEIISSSPNLGSDGTLYIGSYVKAYGEDPADPALRALNPDFSLKWEREFSGEVLNPAFLVASFSPSIGLDGTVYFGALGKVYALDPDDGSDLWVYDTGASQVCTTPAIAADGTVYTTAYDYCLYAINPNGTSKWQNCDGAYNYGSPIIGPTGTVYTDRSGNISAFDPSDGSKIWDYYIGSGYASTPVVASDGTIYYHSFENSKLYAIKSDGTLKWERDAGRGLISSSPSIADNGTVYAASYWQGLYAFE
jgi:prepilin-type N-terminal cleavage/methylation domain-containing protein